MNLVFPETPIADVIELMNRDGYVVMRNALSPEQIIEIRAAFDRELNTHLEANLLSPTATRTEVKRILERGATFEQMMDLPSTFRVARAMIGADIELASGGELDYKLPRTPAFIAWHNDFQWMVDVPYPHQNFWIRCTFLIGDVDENTGPFTLLPGTHTKNTPCPQMVDEKGQPIYIDGQIGITGKAGDCLINNTEIWHTNSPLTGDEPRRLIMLLYKHAWMKQWQNGYQTSDEFAARQTDPIRRQLTGGIVWHQGRDAFPASKMG